MTPKGLLRHKKVVSPIAELISGHVQEFIEEPVENSDKIRRVLLCSGKIYYDLIDRRRPSADHLTIVRIEQFYPLQKNRLRHILERYRRAREFIWVQEESQNMGGWSFMEPQLRELGFPVEYVGRDASASPATGSRLVHLQEQAEIVEAALSGKAPHIVSFVPRASPIEEPMREKQQVGKG